MILEVADIRIPPGKQAEFDEAIIRGITTVVSKSKGFLGYKVNKGIETPERYILLIVWETLENHTVDFRGQDREERCPEERDEDDEQDRRGHVSPPGPAGEASGSAARGPATKRRANR